MADIDSRGLPVSTATPEAAASYRHGIDLILSAWPGAMDALDQATAFDPDFALAHAALARLHALRGQAAQAKASINRAAEAAKANATPRELSHIATVSLAVQGQSREALQSALSHLETWPRDALILSLPLGAFGLFAFSGRADHDHARVALCEQVADHYDPDDWWFLTYRGWSHTENGNVSLGRALTERGFELRSANANAAHALSHAMFEAGATQEAEELITRWLPSYDRSGVLHGHIAWHAALSALERDDAAGALKLYETFVRPSVSLGMPMNVVTDAISLLWRLRAYGYAVPAGLWEEAADYAGARFPNVGVSFVEAHIGMLLAGTDNRGAAETRIAALTHLAEGGRLSAGLVVPELCRAVLAFADGQYAECTRLLGPVLGDVVRIGGSGAQREIVEDTLLLAYMRSGETEKARAMLERRLDRRPSPRDTRWLAQLAA